LFDIFSHPLRLTFLRRAVPSCPGRPDNADGAGPEFHGREALHALPVQPDFPDGAREPAEETRRGKPQQVGADRAQVSSQSVNRAADPQVNFCVEKPFKPMCARMLGREAGKPKQSGSMYSALVLPNS